MTRDLPLPARAWVTVALLWFVACFNYLARVMITTMHGSMLAAIPMSEAQFGLLTSAFLWIYGALNPFAGFLSDRLSRSRVIAVSMLIWSALTWLTAYAKTFHELLIMRSLMGVSEACYFPAALALITEYHQGPTRSLATGLHMTGLLFGAALAGMGGWLAETWSWSFAFSLVGAIGVFYSLILFWALRDAPSRMGEGAGSAAPGSRIRLGPALSSLLGSRSFMLAFAFCGLSGAIGYAVLGWMPTYLQEHFHLRQGEAGISATAYLYMAELAGVFVGGLWADRWSRTRVGARIFVLAIGYCAAAPGVFLTAHTGFLAFAVLGLVLWGLAGGFADSNLMPVLCLVTDRRYRATAYGLTNLAACGAGGLAIYGAGLLRDRGIDFGRMLGWSAGLLLICPLLLLLIRPSE
jgi:MFS family permease